MLLIRHRIELLHGIVLDAVDGVAAAVLRFEFKDEFGATVGVGVHGIDELHARNVVERQPGCNRFEENDRCSVEVRLGDQSDVAGGFVLAGCSRKNERGAAAVAELEALELDVGEYGQSRRSRFFLCGPAAAMSGAVMD